MKAAEFDYVKAKTLEQVFELLDSYGDEARILAGGQTLIPTLNMRLSDPALIIDINSVEALKGVRIHNGKLSIGALTTHTEIEESELVQANCPLLIDAVSHIAHRAIRNSGTWGGSLAYADPAAEWPTCIVALGGTIVTQGPNGIRRISADDFFIDLYTTALQPNEIIVSAELPLKQEDDWHSFIELARRHGDYAIVGVATTAKRSVKTLNNLRIVLLGIGTKPIRAKKTEAFLEGQSIDDQLLSRASEILKEEIEPIGDLTSSAGTKRHLAGVLTERALRTANS